jgi:hypothetical protein
MPRVKITKMSRIALYFLRFYLIFLVGLLLVKFLKVVH